MLADAGGGAEAEMCIRDRFSDGLLMGFTQLFTGVLTILCTLGVMLFIDLSLIHISWPPWHLPSDAAAPACGRAGGP